MLDAFVWGAYELAGLSDDEKPNYSAGFVGLEKVVAAAVAPPTRGLARSLSELLSGGGGARI